ncbi:MAG: hypothetical protein ACLQGP_04795 [Isosphaeraceae bacterium]
MPVATADDRARPSARVARIACVALMAVPRNRIATDAAIQGLRRHHRAAFSIREAGRAAVARPSRKRRRSSARSAAVA